MSKKLTDKEKEIVCMLNKVDNDETFVITAFLWADEDGRLDDLYRFLKTHDNPESEDVFCFLDSEEPDDDFIVADR